jgi:Disulphide bond corrector protein DsbC
MFALRRVAALVLVSVVSASAQKLTLNEPHTKSSVSYLAEPVTIEAGKPADVELGFRIADGLHINSHTPSASELIPTTLTLETTPDIKMGKLEYPAGVKYAFSFAPQEKLSVYTGDFFVKMRVTVAHSGSSTWNGALRYQACDNLQCYPVKTLPISVILTAK